MTNKFKVGDIICGNSKSDISYSITNSKMTKAKVVRVVNCRYVSIEVLEHETHDLSRGSAFNTYNVASEDFDLVESTPEISNKTLKKEFDTTKSIVIDVLKEHPNTRDSDKALYIECAKKLGAKTIDDLLGLDLSFDTVGRVRRIIQYKEGKFLPSDDILNKRRIREHRITNMFRGVRIDD